MTLNLPSSFPSLQSHPSVLRNRTRVLVHDPSCSARASLAGGGGVIVWHNDRERHRSFGTGERNQIASIIGTLLGLAV